MERWEGEGKGRRGVGREMRGWRDGEGRGREGVWDRTKYVMQRTQLTIHKQAY